MRGLQLRGEACKGSVPLACDRSGRTPAPGGPRTRGPPHPEGGLSVRPVQWGRAHPGSGPSRAPPAGGAPRRQAAPRGLAENLLLFITRPRPAAPVNTFLQRVMHRRLTAGAAPPAGPPRTWGWAYAGGEGPAGSLGEGIRGAGGGPGRPVCGRDPAGVGKLLASGVGGLRAGLEGYPGGEGLPAEAGGGAGQGVAGSGVPPGGAGGRGFGGFLAGAALQGYAPGTEGAWGAPWTGLPHRTRPPVSWGPPGAVQVHLPPLSQLPSAWISHLA